ncbi:uncharacterized protein LOC123306963 [Coccinella septempunctata]|uniref:uncharacterized protein LOC123306963 n=1 Tax=Coccinella septempunctata TaxID=41139 RepID=UPI001D0726D2|nr:uncharacterized protein LOC123306963 [Coccinella septempunctata]
MPRIEGPASRKRRILVAAAISRLLYGAEIWAESLSTYTTARDKIRKAQRGVVVSSNRAYKNVSGIAALIIAEMIPADLFTEEKREIYHDRIDKKEAREKTRRKWTEEIRNHRGARWTKEQIQDPLKWMDRAHGDQEHETVQFLSGHGCFGTYRKKIGKSNSNVETAKD